MQENHQMQENHYLVLGDGITREGIGEQNSNDIFHETIELIEGHVDNDIINDDDKARQKKGNCLKIVIFLHLVIFLLLEIFLRK